MMGVHLGEHAGSVGACLELKRTEGHRSKMETDHEKEPKPTRERFTKHPGKLGCSPGIAFSPQRCYNLRCQRLIKERLPTLGNNLRAARSLVC